MEKRYLFIDQLRALAIYLIIFGHNDYNSYFGEYLSSFRLPLFFIISGMVARSKEKVSLVDFLKKYSKRLLVPYFAISILLYGFWLFIGRHYGHSADVAYDPIKNFIGIFYAQGGPEYMNWGIPMWFLPALFMVMFFDFLVSRLPFKYRFIPALLYPIAGLYIYKTIGFHLPWSVDVALSVYGFYFFGALLRRINFIDFLSGLVKPLVFFIVFFVLHYFCSKYNGRVLYYYGEYGNFPIMYLNGILGFMWAFALFKILPTSSLLVWVGRNTLPLLAFHLSAMTVLKAIALWGFGIELQFSLWLSLLYGVLQIIILIPFILLLNRYFPFLVGNHQRKHSEKK